MADTWPGTVGRPTKFNAARAARFLKAIETPVKEGKDKGDLRYRSNAEAAAKAGWGESTLYLYLSIARGVRDGRDHPQAAIFLEFLESYEALDLVREEARIDAARKVIADDLAGRRVKTTIETVAVTLSGTTPLQRLVASLEGEPITMMAQLFPDRGIGKAFTAAREVAQAGERMIRVKKKEEPQLPSTLVARWVEDRTRYRKQAAEQAAVMAEGGDPQDFLPRLRMLLASSVEMRREVREMIEELDAEV